MKAVIDPLGAELLDGVRELMHEYVIAAGAD
jgi:hypothetical protein